jgi:hypothetical protein
MITCPLCGAKLYVDKQAETLSTVYRINPGGMPYVEHVLRPATVAACSGCEFVVEVK